MSNGLEKMFDDISTTSGTPFVSGMNGNSTPTKQKAEKNKQFLIYANVLPIKAFEKQQSNNYRQRFHYRNSTRTMHFCLNSMWIDREW